MLVAVVPYLVRMRTTLRPAAAAVVLVAALSATACTPPPEPPRTPAPSSTPLFASDEEALAAAEAAYAAYLKVSDQITSEGGESPERIDKYVAPDLRDSARSSLAAFRHRNVHTAGSSTFDSTQLQRVEYRKNGVAEVAIYACLDIEQVRLISESGSDVTPADRDNRLPLELSFISTGQSAGLLLQSSDSWMGDNFCARQ
jgi:hypothetical protein